MKLYMRYYFRSIYAMICTMQYRLLDRTVDTGHHTRIIKGSKLEGYNKIHDRSVFHGDLGLCSYIGADSSIHAKIGRFASIGAHVQTVQARHPREQFVSSSPAFYSTAAQNGITFVKEDRFQEWAQLPNENVPCVIGNDVFIGESAILLCPLCIGDGAQIGAGAVVTHDVAPYSIVAGVPAHEIGFRFTESQRQSLLSIKWWDNDIAWFKKNAQYFDDVDSVIRIAGSGKNK